MFFRLADNTNPDSLASRLRRQRMELFLGLLRGVERPRILGVGGTPGMWQECWSSLPPGSHVTLFNLHANDASALPNAAAVRGDACDMRAFADGAFDVAFSNSVIEHVGTFYDQMAMAREVRRVARGYFVQTPNRWFPLEPHFLVPGWQFLPLWLRTRLLCWRDLGWAKRFSDPMLARAEAEQIRLLTAREFRYLFPDATVHRERLGPLAKSFIAVRPPAVVPS